MKELFSSLSFATGEIGRMTPPYIFRSPNDEQTCCTSDHSREKKRELWYMNTTSDGKAGAVQHGAEHLDERV